MDDDLEFAAGFFFMAMAMTLLNQRKRDARGNRRWWVHPINQVRDGEGAWTLLMERFRTEFPDKHTQCMRVSKENFDQILTHVRPVIEKEDTQLRKAIPADQRLCVTLFYLATGDSFKTLALLFRMGESTVRSIVYETSQAIWDTMATQYLKTPQSDDDWRKVATGFERQWNFPNCVGAIDGKHCNVQAPPNSGSEYFNYKKSFSLVLMAVCDSLYRFVYVDVGTPGRWADGGTWDQCSLNQKLTSGEMKLPPSAQLPGSDKVAPFTFVADEAFPLKTWLQRPIPGRSLDSLPKKVFNYRLSRARRTIENTFGIMVSRWRCLRSPLIMLPMNAQSVILACCTLHNFLRSQRCVNYCPPGFADNVDINGNVVPGAWRNEGQGQVMGEIDPTNHRNPQHSATDVREMFIHYFSNEGSVPWQERHVTRV